MSLSVEQVNDLIHEFISDGQMFKSYAHLLENPQLNLSRKKVKEICERCAEKCLKARNMIIEGVNDERITN